MPVPLSELFPQSVDQLHSASDLLAWDITEDSREVKPGWIFAAIKGHAADGKTFIGEAVARGALAVICEEQVPASVPVLLVTHIREALADVAAQVHRYPSRRLTVLGVTGTDGKTTTCYLLTSILQSAGLPTGMLTTVETRVGGQTFRRNDRLTTPGAPLIQRLLAKMAESGDSCAVLEASSHALALNRLRNVSLRGAAITNIGRDHIEFHGSRESYARTKFRLLDLVDPTDAPSMVLNADDQFSMRLSLALPSERFMTYGIENEAALRATIEDSSLKGTTFRLQWKGHSRTVRLPVPGRHNVYNSLASAGLALTQGIDLHTICRGLEAAPMPPGRLQRIDRGQGFSVLIDYAHTEKAFSSVLQLLAEEARSRQGRLIAVFGAAGNRDRDKRPKLGAVASSLCHYFVITNEDPFDEDADSIMREIAAGANPDERGSQWEIYPDRAEAIRKALGRAAPRDIVAITGKGHEHSMAIGRDSVPWDDVRVAEEALQELGY